MTYQLMKIPFHGDDLRVVETSDGHYVALKPICETLGVDWSAQLKRLKGREKVLGVAVFATPSAGGVQDTTCIPGNRLALWLANLNPRTVSEQHRETLELYQTEAADVLDAYFTGRRRGQEEALAASHTHLPAQYPRWGKIHALIKGGASYGLTQLRSNLSRVHFDEEFDEMERCGLVSEEDWYEGDARTSRRENQELRSRARMAEAHRESCEDELVKLGYVRVNGSVMAPEMAAKLGYGASDGASDGDA